MLMRSVARRYATAFFQVANEKNQLEEFQNELQQVLAALDANRELKRVFYHKLIREKDKRNVIASVFADKLKPETINFLHVLIDKKREEYLEYILQAYTTLANEARNILDADVISAVELTPPDIKDLQGRLSKLTGKNVRLRVNVDPKILGGLVVRVGDRVIDGSVSKRLQMLKKNLVKAQLKLSS